MAAVVVIPLIELVAWGVAGIAAMWMAKNPPKILPREAVALPLVAAPESLEGRVDQALAKPVAKAQKHAKTTCRDCPPCVPPVGHVCVFVHMNALSRAHKPCLYPWAGHIHTHIRSQKPPPACTCEWNDGATICLAEGADYMSILNKFAHTGCQEVKNANYF